MSLSGWCGVTDRLASAGLTPPEFFGELVQTGSHPASLAALARRGIDVATIDSTMLTLAARGCHPTVRAEGYRVLDSIGPCPVQPTVVRADLPTALAGAVRQALRALGPWPEFALHGFADQPGLSNPERSRGRTRMSGLPLGAAR